MATCFLCGRDLPDSSPRVRRKVRTGEWSRSRYPKKVTSVNIHYGYRVVCLRCQKRLEIERRRDELIQLAELAVALLVLAVILWFKFFG